MKVKIFTGTVAEMQKSMNNFLASDVREVSHLAVGADDKGKTVIVLTYVESEAAKAKANKAEVVENEQ